MEPRNACLLAKLTNYLLFAGPISLCSLLASPQPIYRLPIVLLPVKEPEPLPENSGAILSERNLSVDSTNLRTNSESANGTEDRDTEELVRENGACSVEDNQTTHDATETPSLVAEDSNRCVANQEKEQTVLKESEGEGTDQNGELSEMPDTKQEEMSSESAQNDIGCSERTTTDSDEESVKQKAQSVVSGEGNTETGQCHDEMAAGEVENKAESAMTGSSSDGAHLDDSCQGTDVTEDSVVRPDGKDVEITAPGTGASEENEVQKHESDSSSTMELDSEQGKTGESRTEAETTRGERVSDSKVSGEKMQGSIESQTEKDLAKANDEDQNTAEMKCTTEPDAEDMAENVGEKTSHHWTESAATEGDITEKQESTADEKRDETGEKKDETEEKKEKSATAGDASDDDTVSYHSEDLIINEETGSW